MNSFKSSAPSGLPQSAQGRLRVRPGASVPLGYGGMPTGVVFSFAARELPRLAPALRFPVLPGGPSETYRGVLKNGGGVHFPCSSQFYFMVKIFNRKNLLEQGH